ncbi:hypothetical protein FTUN_6004 [Frigoriglobus tundricola]|uniref:Uncharacterized protein n=1 Tax=Frigoriglobus tundricola TaxID=2774151 RepID=A0A6M5YY26_9BACT|nr:hypothetical protein FTUN_6004 [Frigoriglobus tundricola]
MKHNYDSALLRRFAAKFPLNGVEGRRLKHILIRIETTRRLATRSV